MVCNVYLSPWGRHEAMSLLRIIEKIRSISVFDNNMKDEG
jgi:hypothetical protein